jgi:hypothetical protein
MQRKAVTVKPSFLKCSLSPESRAFQKGAADKGQSVYNFAFLLSERGFREPTARSLGPPSRVDAAGRLLTGTLIVAAPPIHRNPSASEIEARTFLQFRQGYLIHRKTERRFRHRRSGLRRHYACLIRLECGHREPACDIITIETTL